MKKIISFILVGFMASNAWSGAYAFDNMEDCLVESKKYCSHRKNRCPENSIIWCKKHIKIIDALKHNSPKSANKK